MARKTNIVRTNTLISLFIIIILWCCFLWMHILEVTLNLHDFQWSCIFVSIIFVIYLLRYLNRVNIVTLYSLFYLTTLLFLGGRFISIFLGYDKAPLFEIDFFVYHKLNDRESSILFYWVILGLLSLEIGFYISSLLLIRKNCTNILLHNNRSFLYMLLGILYLSTLQQIISNLQLVLSNGYMALYSSQGELVNYTYNFNALIQTITTAVIGIYLSQDDKKSRKIFLVLLTLISISSIVMGGRGGFTSFILFLIWYFHDYGMKKANSIKILTYGFLLLIFLSVFAQFVSLRELGTESISISDQILSFLYGQGVTLMVFNESMSVENYPINAYFQNFIAGFSFFYSKLVSDIPFYKLSFNSYNSYSINSSEFLQGFGLGWSLFGDAYLHGFRNPILFSIFLIIFAYLLNYLQFNLNKNIYMKIITISLFIPLMFLPRAGLNNVIPIAYYVIVAYWIIRLFNKRTSQ